jgi:hypothetical protein
LLTKPFPQSNIVLAFGCSDSQGVIVGIHSNGIDRWEKLLQQEYETPGSTTSI